MARMTKNQYGYPVLVDEWTPEEINGIAQDMGYALGYDNCVKVLEFMLETYNYQYGIGLETAQAAIEYIVDELKPIDSFFGDIDDQLSKLTIRK